tara:strand:- start:5896 stop:6339 length:444 start_codon:yes stop_codon:yes gene_type:complete
MKLEIMSNLKYKIGDKLTVRSGEVHTVYQESYDNVIQILEIDEEHGCTTLYNVKDEEWLNEVELDFHYDLITKSNMNIEENKHHQLWEGTQSLDIMKKVLTDEEYKGFLKGNILKYQLRVGKKDDPSKEIKKINDYSKELNNILCEK